MSQRRNIEDVSENRECHEEFAATTKQGKMEQISGKSIFEIDNANCASFDEKDLILRIIAKFILSRMKNDWKDEEHDNADRNFSSTKTSRGSSTD